MEVNLFCWQLVFLSKDSVTKVCDAENTNPLIPPLLQRTIGQNQNNRRLFVWLETQFMERLWSRFCFGSCGRSRISSKIKLNRAKSERFEFPMQKFRKKLLESVLRKANLTPFAQFVDTCAKKSSLFLRLQLRQYLRNCLETFHASKEGSKQLLVWNQLMNLNMIVLYIAFCSDIYNRLKKSEPKFKTP